MPGGGALAGGGIIAGGCCIITSGCGITGGCGIMPGGGTIIAGGGIITGGCGIMPGGGIITGGCGIMPGCGSTEAEGGWCAGKGGIAEAISGDGPARNDKGLLGAATNGVASFAFCTRRAMMEANVPVVFGGATASGAPWYRVATAGALGAAASAAPTGSLGSKCAAVNRPRAIQLPSTISRAASFGPSLHNRRWFVASVRRTAPRKYCHCPTSFFRTIKE